MAWIKWKGIEKRLLISLKLKSFFYDYSVVRGQKIETYVNDFYKRKRGREK